MSLANSTPTTIGILAGALLAFGCADNPAYVQSPTSLEVGAPDSMVNTATGTIDLPIKLETEKDLMKRVALADELGLTLADVPYVRIGDLDVSIEWSLKNLSDQQGTAIINVNGGNEMFAFIPAAFVIDPEEDAEPPPLVGGVPQIIEPGELRTGVFREEQILEASVDIELIARGGLNPIAAVLQTHRGMTEMTTTTGAVVPKRAFAQMIRFELTFTAGTHMVLEYAIRVRDQRGILHEELLDAPGDELTVFNPVMIEPPPPPPVP